MLKMVKVVKIGLLTAIGELQKLFSLLGDTLLTQKWVEIKGSSVNSHLSHDM